MAYRNRYKFGQTFGSRHPMIGDALAYGRADMDRVLHEILSIDAVHVPNPISYDL